MADKTLEQGEGLQPTDRTLYVDIDSGVLARVDGAVVMVGAALVSASNPVPTASTSPTETQTGALKIATVSEVAALDNKVICYWVNNKVPGAAQVVLTDGPAGNQPGIYYNLNPGETVMVTQICVELTTLNDDVEYELGYTDAADGAGTFQPITPKRAYATAAARAGFEGIVFEITPPAPVRYADGARSITFRIDCNDAGATITPGWHAYVIGGG